MRNDPWKFESSWRSENWIDQPDIADFLASTSNLYISDKVIGGTSTYFTLNTLTGRIEFWEDGIKIAEWETYTAAVPTIEDGVPMGLLIALTYQT